MSELEYHLDELRIALSADDPARVMPTLPDDFERILDLGCGMGQTLTACHLNPAVFACGIDIDAEALAWGSRLSPGISFLRARGEQLPFSDQSFDVVISRVALPYTHLPSALAEIFRVLRPGGRVWFTLHSFALAQQSLRRALRETRLKSLLYQSYVMVNGLLFHLTGRQFRYPLNQQRCESFQTRAGMIRAMKRAGFTEVTAEEGRFFISTAVRRS
ncbi:MAG: class I SAM-dependent methyltransferase [Blastocatellia bacterium]